MLVYIRGAGDLASGIALRLFHSGMEVVMSDLPVPTSVRRTVCFSEAIRLGRTQVEDVTAVRADTKRSPWCRIPRERSAAPFLPMRRWMRSLQRKTLGRQSPMRRL